ncbi:5-oxoprolinase, partial [Salinisphaera sp. USBA-960]|nr:5-oxoprolinase [Salifodinibacter halophilus]
VLAAFSAMHLKRFSFAAAERSVIIEAVRVEARVASIDAISLRMPQTVHQSELPATARAWFQGWVDVPLIHSSALRGEITGPALIVDPNSTVVLERGWKARRLPGGELMLDAMAVSDHSVAADPARIEIFNNLFM